MHDFSHQQYVVGRWWYKVRVPLQASSSFPFERRIERWWSFLSPAGLCTLHGWVFWWKCACVHVASFCGPRRLGGEEITCKQQIWTWHWNCRKWSNRGGHWATVCGWPHHGAAPCPWNDGFIQHTLQRKQKQELGRTWPSLHYVKGTSQWASRPQAFDSSQLPAEELKLTDRSPVVFKRYTGRTKVMLLESSYCKTLSP